jgi:hypothetical protein
LRHYHLPEGPLKITLNIIEYYHFDFSFNRDIIGYLLVFGGFSLKAYLENFLELFSPAKMTLNAPNAPLSMHMDNSTGQAGGSGDQGNSGSNHTGSGTPNKPLDKGKGRAVDTDSGSEDGSNHTGSGTPNKPLDKGKGRAVDTDLGSDGEGNGQDKGKGKEVASSENKPPTIPTLVYPR